MRLHLYLVFTGEGLPRALRGQEEAGGCSASAERGPEEPPSASLRVQGGKQSSADAEG